MVKIRNEGRGRHSAQSARAKGSLLTAINLPKTVAPATSNIIIAVVRVVSVRDLTNRSQLSLRSTRATKRTDAAPTAPASVGVNQPATSPQSETVKIISTSNRPLRRATIRSRHDALGPGGPS